jgi:hypothetical protein
MPGLTVHGPEDLHRVIPSILTAMAVELVVIAGIWLRYRERAKPFLVAVIFIIGQMLTMGLLSHNPLLENLLVVIGTLPSAAVVMSGFAIGAATSWAGWQAGKRSEAQPKGSVQVA